MPVLIKIRPHDAASIELRFPYSKSTIETLKTFGGPRFNGNRADPAWIIGRDLLPVLEGLWKKALRWEDSGGVSTKNPFEDPTFSDFALRPYQQEGATFLAKHQGHRNGALLADDPGIGKTLQAIAASTKLPAGLRLIICPNTATHTWRMELPKWLGPATRLYACIGRENQFVEMVQEGRTRTLKQLEVRDTLPWIDGTSWMLCHYEIFASWASWLAQQQPQLLLLDEAHAFTNRRAQRTQALLELRKNLPEASAWGLTATPLRSGPRNLWSLVEILRPGTFGGFWRDGEYVGYWGWAKRYCNTPEAPVWMGDFSFKRIGDVQIGDEIIGWAPGATTRTKRTRGTGVHNRWGLIRAKVLDRFVHTAQVVKAIFASGRTVRCTADHLWLSVYHNDKNVMRYVPLKVGRKIAFVMDTTVPSLSPEQQRLAYWLGGMYDGEGSWNRISQCNKKNALLYKKIGAALTALKIPHTAFRTSPKHSKIGHRCGGYQITGGRAGLLRFLQLCQPFKRATLEPLLLGTRFRIEDTVESIVPDGESEVIGLKTTTGNYTAWGYASKNCAQEIDPEKAAYMSSYTTGAPRTWDDTGSDNEEELAKRLQVFMLRRHREDVLEEIPMERTFSEIFLDATQRQRYAAMERKVLGRSSVVDFEAVLGTGGKSITKKLSSATQEVMEPLCRLTSEMKLPIAVAKALDIAATGCKVVLFTHFHDTVEGLHVAFDRAQKTELVKIPVTYVPGSVSPDQRQPLYARFADAPAGAILVANTLSSGVSTNALVCASYAIFLDLEWIADDLVQAEGRFIRIGQKNKVFLEYLVCAKTVDEAMAKKLVERSNWTAVIVGSGKQAKSLKSDVQKSGLVDAKELRLANHGADSVAEALRAMRQHVAQAAVEKDSDAALVGGMETDHLLDDDSEFTEDIPF